MSTDNMPRSVPSIGERRQMPIPRRCSSISRTDDTNTSDRQQWTARRSLIEGEGGRLGFLTDDLNSATMKSASSTPRTHSPSGLNRRSTSCSAPSRKSTQPVKVQRWAGLTRSVCDWDGLRKDPELWVQDGDCAVHLYARGASRRGPSFSVPLRALRQKNCGAMLDMYYAQATMETPTGPHESRRMYSFDNLDRESSLVELYIPAPEHASRGESFDWHITTRNFFAFVLGKPLVGRQMGQAFVDLLERMKLFRSESVNNHQDFLDYAENQGYRDLVECTDYALASLFYAEQYKLRNVWIDAFAHCVGMNDSIALSPEYASISRLSKALITRAYLEVDIHLDRVARALRTFLEEDFSPAYLGLADGARNHLRRFQRFLHHFYVEKFGYWPPPNRTAFPKALYKSMFYDFKSLYDLLVDTQSSYDIASQKPANGGICVLQNVDHFNKRHKFTEQPHPLPLLPTVLGQTTTRTLSSVSQHKKTRNSQLKTAALVAATNGLQTDVANSRIVLAYLDFERTYTASSSQREDKVTAVDARKVRWLLIYGVLQYLSSALRAPDGVRDTEGPDYPLCCLVAGQSFSTAATPMPTPLIASPVHQACANDDYFGTARYDPCSTIQPDCHREDYFASQTQPRRGNSDVSASLKTHVPIRPSSTRPFGPLSTLSARNSRRNSTTLKPTAHCAIIVHGYGDGLNQTTTQAPSQATAEYESPAQSRRSSRFEPQDPATMDTPLLNPSASSAPNNKMGSNGDFRRHTRTRTPLLHTDQLDQMVHIVDHDDLTDSMSRSDSNGSKSSSIWTDGWSAASSKSSADGEQHQFYKASAAEHSGLLGGLVSVDGTRVSLDKPEHRPSTICLSQSDIHPLLRTSSVQQDGFQFDFGIQDADPAGSIGMAFSAPPSPPCSSSTPQASSLSRTMSLTSERRSYVPEIMLAKLSTDATPRKNGRSSNILYGIISSPGELRDKYTNAIKKLENSTQNTTQYGDLTCGTKVDVHPPPVTKTSHATKTPSLRIRIWHDEGKDVKKERRMSSFWRR